MSKQNKKELIISNIKSKKIKNNSVKQKTVIIEHPTGKIKKAYFAIRNFFLGRKSPYENILQYTIRQFLFPDSRGKPSLTATFFVWIMIIISYLTLIACKLAMQKNIVAENDKVTETYVGFSDSLIYLYIVIVGYLGYMFIKRENRESSIEETNGNIITTMIDKAKNFISKK